MNYRQFSPYPYELKKLSYLTMHECLEDLRKIWGTMPDTSKAEALSMGLYGSSMLSWLDAWMGLQDWITMMESRPKKHAIIARSNQLKILKGRVVTLEPAFRKRLCVLKPL